MWIFDSFEAAICFSKSSGTWVSLLQSARMETSDAAGWKGMVLAVFTAITKGLRATLRFLLRPFRCSEDRMDGWMTRWWGGLNHFFCCFYPWKLGKWSNLTQIFHMGWNHQLDENWSMNMCNTDGPEKWWTELRLRISASADNSGDSPSSWWKKSYTSWHGEYQAWNFIHNSFCFFAAALISEASREYFRGSSSILHSERVIIFQPQDPVLPGVPVHFEPFTLW